MISRKIVDTDAFVDMPMTSRLLYYELNWRADDDGFIASPKKITRSCGCSDDDLRILISKQFIIPFESGVVLIKDWRIHNYIRCDRYTETLFTDEKEQIAIDGNNRYLKCHTSGIPDVIPDVIPLVATGKDRLGKDRIESLSPDEPKETAIAVVDKKIKFIVPAIEQVEDYCLERNNGISGQAFVDFYEARGWIAGKNKMKDWKAAVRTWENNRKSNLQNQFATEKPKYENAPKITKSGGIYADM